MNIHGALKKGGVRISYGDKWLVFNDAESDGADMQYYDVYQRKYNQKKNRVIAYAKSLDNALDYLVRYIGD